MSRVITFSRTFPAYHPKAGEPTHFVEKILNKLVSGWQFDDVYWRLLAELNDKKLKSGKLTTWQLVDFWKNLDRSIKDEKVHTIRAGHSRKQGQTLAPAVWSGRPYHDPQIIIAPDMEIKKVWDFHIDVNGIYSINNQYIFYPDGTEARLAENDGLTELDFMNWFISNISKFKGFDGQIICWDENVNY